MLWLLVDTDWQFDGRMRRIGAAMLGVALPLMAYGAVLVVTAPFTRPFAPRIPEDTVLPLLLDLPASATLLIDHGLRVFVPLIMVLALLAVAAWLRLHRCRQPMPLSAWMSLAVGVAVVVQPLAVSPTFSGFAFNQPRLSALGLLALVICLGALLPGLPELPARRAALLAQLALMVLLVAASLHHLFTVLGPRGPATLFALQLVAAATAGGLLIAISARCPCMARTAVNPSPLSSSTDDPTS